MFVNRINDEDFSDEEKQIFMQYLLNLSDADKNISDTEEDGDE